MADRFDQSVDPEYLSLFRDRLRSDTDAIDWLWEHVNPNMAERRRERTAALLAVASGEDRNNVRGRIHVLLVGPGGTGKTALKDWIKYRFDGAVGAGPDSSNAGLRFNANTGEFGVLADAHGGTICLEELGKFDKSEQDALYEAMSEGYFEVNKGTYDMEVPSETRVVAVSNDVSGLAGPLQTRFDFIIEMDDYGTDDTITVATDLYDRFRDAYVYDDTDSKPPLIPQYLAFIAGFRPDYPDNEHARVKDLLERLVRNEGLVGEIREKEAYLRVAYTIARLNRRDLSAYDWVRAVDLIHPELDCDSIFEDVTGPIAG